MFWNLKFFQIIVLLFVFLIMSIPFGIPEVFAQNFAKTITQAVESHNSVAAARADVKATIQRIRVAKGGWFPELEITANSGYEVLNKPSQTRTRSNFSEVNVKVTQLLWDFGATNTRVEKARLRLLRTELILFKTRQDIMLEAANAAIRYRSASRMLEFARKSENNVRQQTGLEKARVRAGGGLSTDVLQAKTQLAGAQARSIQTIGKLSTSLNRYRKIFRSVPASRKSMRALDSVVRELPKSLSRAMKVALKLNPQIRLASVDEVLARETVNETRRDSFLPRIEAVGKSKISRNTGGIFGKETGSSIMVQLRFPFNLGFTSVNTLRASQSEGVAASYRLANARLEVKEAVRNAWTQFNTARSTARLLRDQASLANAFLQKARKERKLGNRSLIDVLAGESALFNAKSDTIAMDAEVLVASFALLHATGQLVASNPALYKGKKRKGNRKFRWKVQGN